MARKRYEKDSILNGCRDSSCPLVGVMVIQKENELLAQDGEKNGPGTALYAGIHPMHP